MESTIMQKLWEIRFCQGAKNNMEDTVVELISEAYQYIEAVEELLIQQFALRKIEGISHAYMFDINEKIGEYLNCEI